LTSEKIHDRTFGSDPSAIFTSNSGCPFCGMPGQAVSEIRYSETAEANGDLPDITGQLNNCLECGIAYPSHSYSIEVLPRLYRKAFDDLSYFDQSPMQSLRKAFMRAILGGHRFLDRVSLNVFQVPLVPLKPRMSVLDVGCGFGEFMDILAGLGHRVCGTEVIHPLVELGRKRGHDVRFGELESLHFDQKFDLILFRAVLYRTRDPRRTLEIAKSLLAPGGEIALVDPCPLGSDYFFRKQFPQGQFYILDRDRYFEVLRRMGFECRESRQIYGCPSAPLKSVRFAGNVVGLLELLMANLLHTRPYMLNYRIAPTP